VLKKVSSKDTNVRFLSDGRLYVDDGSAVNIYDHHFCLDVFRKPIL
jgi:hypothetical protein